MTKDRQKMKKATISYEKLSLKNGQFSRQRCLDPNPVCSECFKQ